MYILKSFMYKLKNYITNSKYNVSWENYIIYYHLNLNDKMQILLVQ